MDQRRDGEKRRVELKFSRIVTSCEPGTFCVVWKLNIKECGIDMGQ